MKRRGVSVLELSVVITILAALLVIATTLLTSLIVHSGRQRETYQHAQAATRFGAALRRDVRSANTITIGDPSTTLRAAMSDGATIDYQAVEDGIERIVRRDNMVRRRELFRMTDLRQLQFARAAGPSGAVVCTWRRPWPGSRTSENADDPLRGHRVVAAPRREVADE